MTQTKTCGECAAWQAKPPLSATDDDERGECRRAHPNKGLFLYLWPQTMPDDWCLSFIPKDSGEDGE